MKRKPQMTKKERKAVANRPARPTTSKHIHCVACGAHLDPKEFSGLMPTATMLTCDHGSRFASCMSCMTRSQELLAEHDRSGQPVRAASAWH